MEESLFKHQVHPKKKPELKLCVNNTVITSYVIVYNQELQWGKGRGITKLLRESSTSQELPGLTSLVFLLAVCQNNSLEHF